MHVTEKSLYSKSFIEKNQHYWVKKEKSLGYTLIVGCIVQILPKVYNLDI